MLEEIRDMLRPGLLEGDMLEDVICLSEQATGEPEGEGKPGNVDLTVRLRKRHPALVLKLDRPPPGYKGAANDWLFPLFDPTKPDITAMCDYIVLCEAPKRRDDRLFAFLCELKSRNIRGAAGQIRNGKIMSEFIIQMARQNRRKMQRLSGVEYRGLLFSTRVVSPKGGFRPGHPPPYQEDPEMRSLKRVDFARGIELSLEWLCA